ncbi:hypothetical protein CR513_44268, partial [Mucuna pruriens]
MDGWMGRSRIERKRSVQEIIGSPKSIQRARPVSVQTSPGLPFTAPMQETDRARMEISAKPTKVVPSEPVLVPPVIHGSNIPGKDKQKGWQGAKVGSLLANVSDSEGLDQNVGVKYEVKFALQYSGAANTVFFPNGVAASLAMSSTRMRSESKYTTRCTQSGKRLGKYERA